MTELTLAWYQTLSTVFIALGAPLRDSVLSFGTSPITAVLLGVLAALSPCQLSTNASAIAYVGSKAHQGRGQLAWTAGAYAAGKVLVYLTAGVLVVLMREGLQAAAIPVAVVTRKVMGPLMLLVGLAMLRLWQPRVAFGQRLSLWMRERARGGTTGGFLLGVAFGFAFCPTLALLFFTYVVPMAVTEFAGPIYPAAFALGTSAPVLAAAGAMILGTEWRLTDRFASWETWIRRAAGVIFLLAGINDTLLYWRL